LEYVVKYYKVTTYEYETLTKNFVGLLRKNFLHFVFITHQGKACEGSRFRAVLKDIATSLDCILIVPYYMVGPFYIDIFRFGQCANLQ